MEHTPNPKPLVSIVIAAYNASEYIRETLDSILEQTYGNLEIIVVDDGSTDNTAAIVKAYIPRVNYYYQKNSGSCASPRNTGLGKIKGDFVTFFDADDIMLPEKIEMQIVALLANPEAVMSIINYRNFKGNERTVDHFSNCPIFSSYVGRNQSKTFALLSEECRRIMIDENFTIASSPVFRSEYLKQEQGFDETLTACEDFHLIYRVAIHGQVIIHPDIGFERRLHDQNMSSDNERMLKNLVKSRSSLRMIEKNNQFSRFLNIRVRQYLRKLQSCLITKGEIISALKLYRKTFPPKSIDDLRHDIKQFIKISITFNSKNL
ncbi:glycosyltransferase family 2 protein [Marinobacter sp.]|uniref:glycosyltransferase family 2 protein n=1 Tax=Marinobacter sp. TaxID=50741 RepID=UPI002B27781E|nr:glycosyltransferase [Marinobacter sp.]